MDEPTPKIAVQDCTPQLMLELFQKALEDKTEGEHGNIAKIFLIFAKEITSRVQPPLKTFIELDALFRALEQYCYIKKSYDLSISIIKTLDLYTSCAPLTSYISSTLPKPSFLNQNAGYAYTKNPILSRYPHFKYTPDFNDTEFFNECISLFINTDRSIFFFPKTPIPSFPEVPIEIFNDFRHNNKIEQETDSESLERKSLFFLLAFAFFPQDLLKTLFFMAFPTHQPPAEKINYTILRERLPNLLKITENPKWKKYICSTEEASNVSVIRSDSVSYIKIQFSCGTREERIKVSTLTDITNYLRDTLKYSDIQIADFYLSNPEPMFEFIFRSYTKEYELKPEFDKDFDEIIQLMVNYDADRAAKFLKNFYDRSLSSTLYISFLRPQLLPLLIKKYISLAQESLETKTLTPENFCAILEIKFMWQEFVSQSFINNSLSSSNNSAICELIRTMGKKYINETLNLLAFFHQSIEDQRLSKESYSIYPFLESRDINSIADEATAVVKKLIFDVIEYAFEISKLDIPKNPKILIQAFELLDSLYLKVKGNTTLMFTESQDQNIAKHQKTFLDILEYAFANKILPPVQLHAIAMGSDLLNHGFFSTPSKQRRDYLLEINPVNVSSNYTVLTKYSGFRR